MSGAYTFDHPVFNPHPDGVDLGTVMVMPTGANIVYLRSTGPADYDPPALTGRIVPTLAAALKQMRASKADTILALPGHSESVADATMLDNLVAGTRIVGFGRGANMPTFRWTATGSQWILDDANVLFRGLRLRMEGANGVVKAIAWTGADCRIQGCDIELASGATAKATIGIELTTGAARADIVGNRFRGTATHNVTDGVLIAGVIDGATITDNQMIFSATAANGNIRVGAVAATNMDISRNRMANTHTASTACIALGAAAMTGICADNRMSTLNDGTATAQGITVGAGCLVRFFENYSSDEAGKSGVLTPGVVAT